MCRKFSKLECCQWGHLQNDAINKCYVLKVHYEENDICLDIKCSEDFLACAESSANLSAVSGVTYKITQLINVVY